MILINSLKWWRWNVFSILVLTHVMLQLWSVQAPQSHICVERVKLVCYLWNVTYSKHSWRVCCSTLLCREEWFIFSGDVGSGLHQRWDGLPDHPDRFVLSAPVPLSCPHSSTKLSSQQEMCSFTKVTTSSTFNTSKTSRQLTLIDDMIHSSVVVLVTGVFRTVLCCLFLWGL